MEHTYLLIDKLSQLRPKVFPNPGPDIVLELCTSTTRFLPQGLLRKQPSSFNWIKQAHIKNPTLDDDILPMMT